MTKSSLQNLYNSPGLLDEQVSQWLKRWAYRIGNGNIVYVYHRKNIGYVKQKLREAGYPDIPVKQECQSCNP